ncbi:MAG TPA: DUF3800 domain-containing protein [Ramlibacter sp.]|jgi:hypothetical protein
MTRRYIFADEAGDFTFRRGDNISRYFIVCTVSMDDCDCAHALHELRRDLIWRKEKVGHYFHATTDAQSVRDAVFATICKHDFKIQATIMEKSKAMPRVRESEASMYKYGWFYHFQHAFAPHIEKDDELLITAATIGTKAAQKAFTKSVNDVVQQHVPRHQWATSFWPSASDPCLQVADYCTWAIQRKWERDDSRSYALIADRITRERDLWQHGAKHYY